VLVDQWWTSGRRDGWGGVKVFITGIRRIICGEARGG